MAIFPRAELLNRRPTGITLRWRAGHVNLRVPSGLIRTARAQMHMPISVAVRMNSYRALTCIIREGADFGSCAV
jgi:hypothetical protein